MAEFPTPQQNLTPCEAIFLETGFLNVKILQAVAKISLTSGCQGLIKNSFLFQSAPILLASA